MAPPDEGLSRLTLTLGAAGGKEAFEGVARLLDLSNSMDDGIGDEPRR